MDHNYCKKESLLANRMCCVSFCTNRQSQKIENKVVSMFAFPKKKVHPRRHNLWVKILRIGKKVPKNAFVCSSHFKDDDWLAPTNARPYPRLKRIAVPSLNLPTSSGPPKDVVDSARSLRAAKRQPVVEILTLVEQPHDGEFEPIAEVITELSASTESSGEIDEAIPFVAEPNLSSAASQTDESYGLFRTTKADVGCQTDVTVFTDIQCQTKKLLSVEQSTQTMANATKHVETETEEKYITKPVTFIQITTDDELKTWTGLGSLYLLHELTDLVIDIECKRRMRFDLSTKDRIILTMIVLKHVMQFNMLATLYNVSDRCISKYFNSTLLALSEVMHPLIYWPSEEENFHSMPMCFGNYTDTTIVLDCTECKCAKLSCLNCRIATYSFYKSGHTVKYLLGVTPAGTINYISRGYPGRASDKFIFNNENVINLLNEGDAVMTDKGFSIEKELATKGITLYRPPFLQAKKQFTETEAIQTKNIARARVHVERAIERVKRFKIFKGTIPPHLLGLLDHAMIVCCGLVNLSPGILADDKF